MKNFTKIKEIASLREDDDLAKMILELNTSTISRDVRFFYPFEVQITDKDSHVKNTEGEASHQEYKKSQVRFAMQRLFKPIIELKGLS